MEVHNVSITVTGKSFADCLASLGASTGAPSLSLASYSDEQLLAELRQRMAKSGLVVRIAKFDGESDQTELPLTKAAEPPVNEVPKTEAAGKRSPGRPRNADRQISDEGKAVAAEKAAAAAAAAEAKREAPKAVTQAVADEWDEDPAEDQADEVATKVTKEDVKAALNEFNAIKGMVTARTMLERVGGSQKLIDVDPKRYAAVVAEIKRELAASKAAA